MPKYVLIGLGIPLIVFLSMYLWSILSEEAKNRVIASIFGIIAIVFVVLIGLLVVGTIVPMATWWFFSR